MKLGKKCYSQRNLARCWSYFVSGHWTLCSKERGMVPDSQGKKAYLTGKVPSTASVVKNLDKDTLSSFMIVKMKNSQDGLETIRANL